MNYEQIHFKSFAAALQLANFKSFSEINIYFFVYFSFFGSKSFKTERMEAEELEIVQSRTVYKREPVSHQTCRPTNTARHPDRPQTLRIRKRGVCFFCFPLTQNNLLLFLISFTSKHFLINLYERHVASSWELASTIII